MEHLDGKIAKPKEEMTEEELQFHYFKVHDYNNDNKLDGIELISALTHHNGLLLSSLHCHIGTSQSSVAVILICLSFRHILMVCCCCIRHVFINSVACIVVSLLIFSSSL